MLGFWNKSVFITYLGCFLAVFGLVLGIKTNNIDYVFYGSILAMICDMFDGKVARSIKNRSDKEKEFGVQIDSLADIVAFIVVPSVGLYVAGLNELYQIALIALYACCGVIRLAYFNVCMSDKDKAIDYFTGVPVTVSPIVLGVVWLLGKAFSFDTMIVYTILLPILGYLHISKVKVKKFTNTWFYVVATILAILCILLGIFL